MIISIPTNQSATAEQFAEQAIDQTIAFLTSPKAQDFYRTVITTIVLIFVVIGLAAVKMWREYLKPAGIIIMVYASDKIKAWAKKGWARLAEYRGSGRVWLDREWQNLVQLSVFAMLGEYRP